MSWQIVFQIKLSFNPAFGETKLNILYLPTYHLKKFLLIFSLLIVGFISHSQLNNSLLVNANSDSLIPRGSKFGFFIDNVNYIRNTEYHSEIEQGATWAGTQIWPQAIYRFNDNIHFKAGLFLQKDLGNNKFRPVIPTYTVSYTKKNLKINFGTIEGSLDHNLIEPLYAMENFIDKRIENGLQIKGRFSRLVYDTWIDWEKMIYRTSKSPEQFTVGISTDLKIIEKPNINLSFPVQITVRHQGGEIYSQPHTNIKSQFNFAYGTHLTKKMPGKIIDKIDIQGYLTFYEDIAPSKADSFIDGTGQYFAITLSHKFFGVMLNYWDAHQFVAPLGEPLYVSKSRITEGNYLQYRKMVMCRIMYEMPLWNKFGLVARINNIYDLSEKEYDQVIEMYLKFNIGF